MKNLKLYLLIPVILISLSGCFGVDGEFSRTRNFVLKNVDGNFSKDVEFGIGKVTLYLAKKFVDMEDDEVAKAALEEVSKVQISVHNNLDGICDRESVSTLVQLGDKLRTQGWKTIVRSKNLNEYSSIFIREKSGKQNLLILSMNKEEFAMVEVEGNLYRLINEAVKERKLNMHFANN